MLLLIGIGLNVLGWYIMDNEPEVNGYKIKYGWVMILGVVFFGAGFLYILYSLIRKVERHSLLEERAVEQEKNAADN